MFSAIRSAALGAAVVAVIGMSASAATVVTFQDGATSSLWSGAYDGTQDATMNWGGAANNNTGGSWIMSTTGLAVHSLLQFDISSLAGKGTIDSATLKLTRRSIGANDQTYNVYIYQLADANAGWQQGTGTGSAATAGDVTWNNRIHSSTPWAGSAGASTAGTDYISTPVATISYEANVANGLVYEIPLSNTLIEHWISGPNAGLIIMAEDGTYGSQDAGFFTSEAGLVDGFGTTADRPLLEVTYTPVPEPATGALILLAGAGLAIRRKR
ncbi:MAG: DNRLRE domain-containing protein [Phycisphaerales bacterium]|jgi:hypothetical protein|nr:DNRLRE domain-containing protein [Phycisphaerales bacterium]